MDRRRAGALLALAACVACTAAAPTASNQTALDLYDGAAEGCYYNFQHYGEGDRIMTNEPCLNCTCHNRMLMCYLRVCPFTKPIGQDCTVEKRADQCCPIVTCPDVPVDLLTSTSTTSPAEYGATGLGKLDKYGCSIEGKYFPEGSKVPPTPNKPCEHCYCIRNMTTCVMQECTLHVDGCTPIYHKDVCCPVRYSCDHPEDEMPLLDDMSTTVRPTPGFLLTTTTMAPVTQMTQDCVHDDQIFADGALIKTEKACEHCYCMKGDIVCVVQECGTPMENEGKNCTSLPPREGQCCPDTYICEGDDLSSESTTETAFESITTLSPPRRSSVEGSGYRNEPDDTATFTKMPTQETEYEGSGEEQTTVQPSDHSEKLPSTDEEPSDEIHKLSTISEIPKKTEQPKATTEPSILHTTMYPTSEQASVSDIEKDDSSLPVTIEPQEYLPASTSGTEDKEDETTEDYLVTSEPEDLASHHHKPSSIVTESYTDISTEAGEDLNTVPIEETFEPHKHVPTSHDNEKEKEKFTPSVVEKQTEPEERFSSTSGFAESTESTKLGELDVTTKSEKHDLEKDVATTVDSVKDEIEKETVKPHYDATESYPTSAQSVPTDESEKSTTEPDHSQNTVMTAEEDNVLGTKPTDDVKQTTTPQSVESGSGEEDIAEDNLVVPHEHSSTTVSSQQEDTSTTAERESELSDKTLHPSESDESGSKTTIESSTLPYLTTAIKVEQSTVTTEPSFRKEDKIPVSSEKSDRPEVTTSKSDLTEEEFIPASPHDETLSTGVLVTEDETSTLPDQAIDTQEPAITSSTEYSILTETKPSIPSEQESELEPEIPGSESLPEKTTEVSDVDVHQEPSRIPGEGDCLLDGVTYTNNSRVPSNNKCYSGCKCVSSIIKCDPIICSSPPDYMHNCQSIYDTPDSCCPTYVCDHPRETAPPQSDNQMSVTELPMTSSSIECRGDQCEIITVTKKPESTDSEHCGPQGCESGVTKPTDTQLPSDHSDKCHGDQCGISPTDCSDGDCQQVPDQICDPEHGCQAMPVKPCEGEHCKDIIEQSVPHLPAKCEKETGCEDGTQQTVCQGDSCKIDTNIIEPSSETQQPQTKPECTEEACKKTEITPSEGQVTSECKDDECGSQFETTSEENVDLKEGSSVPDIGTTLTPEKSDVTNVYDSQDTSTKKDKPYEAETEKTEDVDKPTVELSTPETIENVHPTETSDIHKQTDTVPELPITDMEPQTSSEGYQTTSQDINEQEITTTSYKTEIVETSTLAQDVTPSKPSEVSLPLDIDDQKQDTTPTISSGDIEYTTVRQEPETDKETSQKPGYDESFEATTVGFSLPAENEQDTDKAVTISSGMPGTDTITSDLSNILSTTTISVDQDKLSTDVSKLEPHVTKSQESSETIGITTEAIATKTPEAYATEGVIPEEPQTIQGHVVEVTTSPTKPDETFTEIEDSFVTGSQGVTTIEPVEKEYFDTTTDRVESVTYEKPEPTETITADVTELQDKTTKTDIVQEEQIAVTPSLPHIDKPHKSIPDHVSVSPTRTPDESTSYEKLDSVTTTLSTEPISQSDQSTESLANELLIPVEPTKTESPEKTPITSDTEDKVINVPQGQETYTTDEPETDTEEPVISPEKENSETPIENITEQPQEMPEQIDSHTINTDLPSNIAPGKPTTELDIKLEESFTPKPPLQTTETEFQAIDEMRTELPIDQAPETMVTVKEGDGVTPYIPSDKISTESLKETETEKEKLPATTINDTEEVTKSPIKDTGSKVTDKEPKPETGSPVYEEPVTKYPVREMAENEKDVTNIPETKPLGDKTEAAVPSKESNVETTTQQYTDTSATETTSYPVQLEKEKTTQSEIVYEEDKVTKAPVDSPVTELTISQTTGTISSNVQSETDTEYSTRPIDVNVSQLPENEDVTKSPIKDDKYEEDVTKIQVQTSQEPESISTTAQEDIVTKSPVYSGPEGTKEETVTVKPEDTTVSEVLSTKLDEVATKMPEYSEVTKIESTKQEETVTTSSEQTDVTRKGEHVTPQDEMPSSVTESLTVITRVPETSDAYGVQTTKKSEMDAEVTDKTTESEDIPKESITETPGKSEEPEIIVTVLPEMTSKLPEVMKEPESLVTGQDDVITSTAFPGIDDEQPETSDTRRQEPDAATHKDDTTDKTTEIPKDVIPPETEVTSHEQVSTEISERTTQYYNKVTEAATTESYIDDKEKEQAPDTDEQISSDGTSTSKLPDDTKYVNVAVTSQDNIVTQSPEHETEITKEHEYVTKLPESGEPTTQDEHVTGKTETVAPITDIVTEKQEIISPHENVDKQETTTEQIDNIQTTPELVILEEHTHKPVLEASSTLTPFEEEITTVIDETMQYIPVGETPTQKPSLESMEKVTEDATTVSSAVEDIITTVFESTPSEPKPTISSEETISSDLEDKEVSTPSSLVPHEFDKSPISNIGGDQSSEDKLSESKPAGEESSEETSDGKPGKGESTEQTPIEEKPTEDKSGEAKPSEEVPIEPSEEGTITEKPSEDKPSEERPIEGKPSEEKLTDDKKSDGKPSEERPSEEAQSEERPIEEKPSKEKPSDSKPSDESPLEEKPTEETLSVESQIKEKPEEETGEAKPTGETPTAEKPSEEKPGEETPVEEKPEEQGTGEAKPTEESPIAEKPSGEKTSEERPVEEKPEEEGTGEAKPTEEGPIAEKPSEETPVEEKPEEEGAGEAKPTEESPTAEKPSGEKASEERPVEEKPEQEGTSDAKPTEEGPIAEKPSEEKPSEESPVEEKPEEGTDEAKPTGESPITEKPSEEKPSEESPVEEKPEEEGTGEAKPTEESPIAEKPSEEKPSEESPVEEKPEEEGTGEAKPTGETPIAEKPSEEKPSEESPVEEKPEEKETGEAKPTGETPIAEKPSEEKPSEEGPVEEKPEEEGTSEAKPTGETPIAEKPSKEKPSEESPVEEKPEEEGTGEAKPTGETPIAEKPSEEKPSEESPVEEKPEEEGTGEAKPTEESTIAEKPSEEKPSEESPVEEKPEEEGTGEAKPTGETPIAEKPSEEKPSEESPVEEKPEEEETDEAKPTGETPIAEKPSEEKPSEESPVEEKPEEEGTGEAKPTGETPISEKPSEEKPSEESPVEEKPEEEGTGEAKPTEESPIAEKPSEEKPSEESPVEEKPGEEGTGEAKPTEEGPIAEKPNQDKTGDDKPTEEGPTAEKPSQDKTGDDKPTEEGPLEERPSAGKPADEGPIEEKPSEGKPSEEGSIHEKPNDVEPTEMGPVEEKPNEKKPEEGKPTEEGSIEEKPSEGKPSEESPIGDKPSEGLPSKDTSVEESEAKPDEESPSKSKPSEEIPIGEKPSDDKTEEGKPSEAKPDEESPIEGKPIEGSPIGEKPSEEKTSESKPSEGKPDGESPIKEKPDESKPSETKPDEESSIEEKPSEGKPSKDKPSEAKPDEESSIEEKPSQGKPTEEQPSEAKPDEESSIEEKPSEGKPSEDKPSEVKPDEESSIEEKPSKGKPSDESPIEEKPMDDKTGEGRPTEEKPMEPSEPTAETPKPIVPQSTDELPTPEEDGYFPPSGMGYGEPEESEDDQAFGPGTCRYGGKVYVSAQQIPRDDPCDFCFCFRSDIICLQQSCPPPIHGCHEEPIQGFCCPRYECPVSMATTVNVTTTTTTTTTTLPPHFPTHSYKGAAQRRGCQIKGHTYKVGEVVRSASGPCLHCTCGGDGQMKCDPKACTPEPMLRQMIAAAVSAKRRR